jgi:hypothetical protein
VLRVGAPLRELSYAPTNSSGDRTMSDDAKRWQVIIHYDLCTTEAVIDELWELHDIVERGPDFNTIKNIEVTYNYRRAA